jgi:PIN domain nuclease of toxin-antitoxin system
VRVLVDTHALLWWWTNDSGLSDHARDLLQDESNEILVSAASAWEIATKYRLGKLGIGREPVERFDELVGLDGFTHLPVTHAHALRAGSLDTEHRDPFDRMLAAQSFIENAPLLTRDPIFKELRITTTW